MRTIFRRAHSLSHAHSSCSIRVNGEEHLRLFQTTSGAVAHHDKHKRILVAAHIIGPERRETLKGTRDSRLIM